MSAIMEFKSEGAISNQLMVQIPLFTYEKILRNEKNWLMSVLMEEQQGGFGFIYCCLV